MKTKCPYKLKEFDICPSCRYFRPDKTKKECPYCKKDIIESYMLNVKNGKFA